MPEGDTVYRAARLLDRHLSGRVLVATDFRVPQHATADLSGGTVVCASEGNHGRAVARAARDAGCAARVYMAHDVAQSRVDAIAGEGAAVIRVEGSYDDAVRTLQEESAANGWTIVSRPIVTPSSM